MMNSLQVYKITDLHGKPVKIKKMYACSGSERDAYGHLACACMHTDS